MVRALSLSFITKRGHPKNTVVSTKSNIQIEKNAIGERIQVLYVFCLESSHLRMYRV